MCGSGGNDIADDVQDGTTTKHTQQCRYLSIFPLLSRILIHSHISDPRCPHDASSGGRDGVFSSVKSAATLTAAAQPIDAHALEPDQALQEPVELAPVMLPSTHVPTRKDCMALL